MLAKSDEGDGGASALGRIASVGNNLTPDPCGLWSVVARLRGSGLRELRGAPFWGLLGSRSEKGM